MATTLLDDSATPVVGPRPIDDTGVLVHPLAIDGGVFGWAAGAADTARVLDTFHFAGGNLITTADHYAGGRSEVMIGSWLNRMPRREGIVIATSVGQHPDAAGLSRRSILRAVDASLNRLKTDYVDFLSLGGEDPATPIEESLEAADVLIRQGKVRFLAESGYRGRRIIEIEHLAAELDYPRFHALLVPYSLMEREQYERRVQAAASRMGRSALALLPLANGYLAGRFRNRHEFPQSPMYAQAMMHVGRRGSRILDVLDAIADEVGETPARVALAWVLVKPGIAAAVLEVKDADQLTDYLGADTVQLSRQHIARLDRLSL